MNLVTNAGAYIRIQSLQFASPVTYYSEPELVGTSLSEVSISQHGWQLQTKEWHITHKSLAFVLPNGHTRLEG